MGLVSQVSIANFIKALIVCSFEKSLPPPNVVFHFSCHQGPDFDDMLSFFPCEIDDAIQYINLGYGAQAPKIVIL